MNYPSLIILNVGPYSVRTNMQTHKRVKWEVVREISQADLMNINVRVSISAKAAPCASVFQWPKIHAYSLCVSTMKITPST